MSEYFTFLFLVLGVLFLCDWFYKKGVKNGTEITLEKLQEEKIISFKTDGEIYPNPFYQSKAKDKQL